MTGLENLFQENEKILWLSQTVCTDIDFGVKLSSHGPIRDWSAKITAILAN